MSALIRKVSLSISVLVLLAFVMIPSPALAQTATEDDIAYEVLAEATNEPTVLDVAADGRVVWGERDGTVQVLTPQGVRIVAGELRPAANICVPCTPEPDYLSHPPNPSHDYVFITVFLIASIVHFTAVHSSL